VLRAVALVLTEHPRLNGRVIADAVETSDAVHLGLAVDADDVVLVPVIRHADRKSIAELATEAAALADAARAGRLPPAASQGGTFTVSTLGAAGIDWFTPVLNAPQIAILGVGRIAPRAVVRDGAVVVAPTMHLTLVFDHRAVDGRPAARFLAALRARLEAAAGL
jgi:pyruvate dehydrogenase E2 component (dihydrolipoamide acetyltransferase)